MFKLPFRAGLIRQAWRAVGLGRFSEQALFARIEQLAPGPFRAKIRLLLPSIWEHQDDECEPSAWLVATGLDGEGIDAINAALGEGLPEPGRKAGLHAYALRHQDFPALLCLAFIAARLATPYQSGGPHRKVRDQFWYAPELAVIVIRCLPPKLDMSSVEQVLRVILGPPAERYRMMSTAGVPPFPPGAIGEPDIRDYLQGDVMGMVEFEPDKDEEA